MIMTMMTHLEIRDNLLNVDFYPSFLTKEYAESLFNHLESVVPWSKEITPGRRVNQNYGDSGLRYTLNFGGYGDKPLKTIEREVLPWNNLPALIPLKERLSAVSHSDYNYCVIQRYPNGNVGINPHRDREMRPDTDIAGISLGATRTLTMSRYSKEIKIVLPPGSLYVLKSPTNTYWNHSIDIDPHITNARISLTFRLQYDS